MSKIFFTADTHFGHKNIIKYCERPFSDVHEMNKTITQRWNERISKEDTVYHLGDFCFGKPGVYIEKLNGTIILIRGNHDKSFMGKYFEKHRYLKMQIGRFNCLLNHRPVYPIGTPDPFNDHDMFALEKSHDCDIVLCGHVHEKWLWAGKSLNVGVDQHNFYPLSIEEIIELIENKK